MSSEVENRFVPCGYCGDEVDRSGIYTHCKDFDCVICEDCSEGMERGGRELAKHRVFHPIQASVNPYLQLPPLPPRA